MLVVAVALYLTAHRLAGNEVISISPHVIQVETGLGQVRTSRRLKRNWARVVLSRRGPQGGYHRSRPVDHDVGSDVGRAQLPVHRSA